MIASSIYNFYKDLPLIFFTVVRNLVKYKSLYLNIDLKKNISSELLIIAYGPSLIKDYESNQKDVRDMDRCALNYFSCEKMFSEIRPNLYVLADKLFWSDNKTEYFEKKVSNTYAKLKQADWRIDMFVPSDGYKYIKSEFEGFSLINVHSIPASPYNFKSDFLHRFFIRNFITNPFFGTVLSMSIWVSLALKYKKVNIIGANFDAFKNLTVDANNYVSSGNTLFSRKKMHHEPVKFKSSRQKMMHERLFQIAGSYKELHDLAIASSALKVQLINLSSDSMIDSIKRP